MRLMRAFYGRLLTTRPETDEGAWRWPRGRKATALADAQRELIARGGRYSHPYFWGAFVLVGQMK